MTPKQIIPKHLRKGIEPYNKEWFQKYQTELEDPPGYYANVREFLEFCAFQKDKDISDIDDTDVALYIKTLKSYGAKPRTINRRLSALSGFRTFLHSNGKKFLPDLPSREDTDKDENPTDIKALSLIQLNYARKYNCRYVKDEYIFELFFQLGIGKNDLIACKFPENRNAQVDEIIKKVPKGDVALGTIDSYFTRVTKELQDKGVYDKSRRKVNSYDLIESHKAYFLKCPNCGKSFENTAKYWVLARVNIDEADCQDEYCIVCTVCKGAK
jgi:site-specific recombinase XerD